MSWIDELTYDERGLVPVVTQEATTGEVLMMAYANEEALRRTESTGFAHYWSRSRGELWKKGDTSGHLQAIIELRVDCDSDAVLYRVRQTGPACHTLEHSCFHRKVEEGALQPAAAAGHVLARIEETVAERCRERPEGSYTTYLFDKGLDKILKKVGEEATEVVIAAKNDGAELASESADLLFHLLVLFRERELPLARIWEELESRFGAPPRPLGRRAEQDSSSPVS